MRSGFGVNKMADGKTYIGFFKDDKKHGYGIYQWDGKEYSGWWTENK